MSEDRGADAEADEDGGGGDEKFFSAGKSLSTVTAGKWTDINKATPQCA